MLKSILILIMSIAAWELFSSSLDYEYFFPGPSLILSSYQPVAFEGLLVTLLRALFGFVIGVAASYALLAPLWALKAIQSADDQFSAARTVPIVAATPLLIMWFGFGETARIIIVALSVLAFTIGPLAEIAQSLSRNLLIVKSIVGKNRAWEYFNIVVPGSLSDMIGPLRVSFAIAFTTAVAVDFMGSTVGVGRVIDSARVTFNVPLIFLMLILSGITGLLVDRLLKWVLRKICHWRGRTIKS